MGLAIPDYFQRDHGCSGVPLGIAYGRGLKSQDVWRREVLHRAALFYANDVLVVPTDSEWLQGSFDTLTAFFVRVGIWNNFRKMFGIL